MNPVVEIPASVFAVLVVASVVLLGLAILAIVGVLVHESRSGRIW